MHRWILVASIACDPATKRDDAPPPPPDAAPIKRPPVPFKIRWIEVRDTPPCFYFSGPEGRDDKLVGTVTIERAELGDGDISIKINGVTFRGTFKDRELFVTRKSEHTHGGPWTATEEIRGKLVDNVLTGTYRYRECEHGTPCPGDCTIDADIRFER